MVKAATPTITLEKTAADVRHEQKKILEISWTPGHMTGHPNVILSERILRTPMATQVQVRMEIAEYSFCDQFTTTRKYELATWIGPICGHMAWWGYLYMQKSSFNITARNVVQRIIADARPKDTDHK